MIFICEYLVLAYIVNWTEFNVLAPQHCYETPELPRFPFGWKNRWEFSAKWNSRRQEETRRIFICEYLVLAYIVNWTEFNVLASTTLLWDSRATALSIWLEKPLRIFR